MASRQSKSDNMEDFIIYRININELKKLLAIGNNVQQEPEKQQELMIGTIDNLNLMIPSKPLKIFFDRISDTFPSFESNIEKIISSVSFMDKPNIECSAALIIVYQSGARLNKPQRLSNEIISLKSIGIKHVGLIIMRLVTGDQLAMVNPNDYIETSILGNPFVVEFHCMDMNGTLTNPSRTNEESFKIMSTAFECLQYEKSRSYN